MICLSIAEIAAQIRRVLPSGPLKCGRGPRAHEISPTLASATAYYVGLNLSSSVFPPIVASILSNAIPAVLYMAGGLAHYTEHFRLLLPAQDGQGGWEIPS